MEGKHVDCRFKFEKMSIKQNQSRFQQNDKIDLALELFLA